MSQIYHDLQKFSSPFLEGWRKTRKRNFLLFAFALLLKRTCCLSHLARALPFETLAQSKVNRLFRFLKSQKDCSFDDFFAKMVLWVLRLFAHRDRLVLVLDTTFVKEWMIISVILPYKGRGLVLKMDAYPISALPFCQTDLYISFLERLFRWLDFDKSRFVLVADRGFALVG